MKNLVSAIMLLVIAQTSSAFCLKQYAKSMNRYVAATSSFENKRTNFAANVKSASATTSAVSTHK